MAGRQSAGIIATVHMDDQYRTQEGLPNPYMIENTNRPRRRAKSTSEGKSDGCTTRQLVKARASEGHGAMLKL